MRICLLSAPGQENHQMNDFELELNYELTDDAENWQPSDYQEK